MQKWMPAVERSLSYDHSVVWHRQLHPYHLRHSGWKKLWSGHAPWPGRQNSGGTEAGLRRHWTAFLMARSMVDRFWRHATRDFSQAHGVGISRLLSRPHVDFVVPSVTGHGSRGGRTYQ